MPAAAVVGSPQESSEGRPGLLLDEFTELQDDWHVHASKAHPRSSFQNEGKVGAIYTPANRAVFVERTLPAGVRLVEATFDVGTDRSATWGPGKPVERTLRVNLTYTGLTDSAAIRHEGGDAKQVRLDRRYGVELPVKIGPQGMTWVVIE